MDSEIASKVKDAERIMKATSNSRMSYSSIVEMSHDLQENKPKVVHWSRANQEKPNTSNNQPSVRSRDYSGNRGLNGWRDPSPLRSQSLSGTMHQLQSLTAGQN